MIEIKVIYWPHNKIHIVSIKLPQTYSHLRMHITHALKMQNVHMLEEPHEVCGSSNYLKLKHVDDMHNESVLIMVPKRSLEEFY